MPQAEQRQLKDSTEQFMLPGNSVGVLLIHGFGSSPAEMIGLGEYLHRRGYTVKGVRLAGHGTNPRDMRQTKLQDWMQSAEEGLRELLKQCGHVYIVGQSMGGLIALRLTREFPVHGVILLSPPMFQEDWRWRVLPVAKYFLRWYRVGGGADPAEYRPPYTLKAYSRTPTASVGEFLKLVQAARQFAPQVQVPVLILQGSKDGIIPPLSGEELLSLLGSQQKALRFYERSNHILTLDKDRQRVWQDTERFIHKLSKNMR